MKEIGYSHVYRETNGRRDEWVDTQTDKCTNGLMGKQVNRDTGGG